MNGRSGYAAADLVWPRMPGALRLRAAGLHGPDQTRIWHEPAAFWLAAGASKRRRVDDGPAGATQEWQVQHAPLRNGGCKATYGGQWRKVNRWPRLGSRSHIQRWLRSAWLGYFRRRTRRQKRILSGYILRLDRDGNPIDFEGAGASSLAGQDILPPGGR